MSIKQVTKVPKSGISYFTNFTLFTDFFPNVDTLRKSPGKHFLFGHLTKREKKNILFSTKFIDSSSNQSIYDIISVLPCH